jgi:hypothetical protein
VSNGAQQLCVLFARTVLGMPGQLLERRAQSAQTKASTDAFHEPA